MANHLKYKPEFCQALIEHMKSGLSFETFAAIAKVHRDTLYQWVKEYPEFKEAKDEAFLQNQLFFEKLGIDGAKGKVPGFNVTAWIFNMKNRHGWRDKQKDESDTVINNITNHVSQLTDEQLEEEFQKELKKELVKRGIDQ